MSETITPNATKVQSEKGRTGGSRRARQKMREPTEQTVLRPLPVAGLDVSEKHLQLCEIDLDGVISEGRFPNTSKKIREQFEGKATRRIILEMGCHARWITELLRSLGHEVMVVDPRRLKLISGTLYKDDKLDAQTLAMLGADVPRLLKTVPLRELEHQKLLTLVRARAAAVASRTRIVNAMRGMLKPYGYRLPKSNNFLTFCAYLWQEVKDELLRLVEPLMQVLDTLNRQIDRYDNEAEKLLPELPLPARQLREIPGVGPLTVLYFVALIGNPHRFKKGRDVGAYLGLCKGRDDSGEYQSELKITKAGDRYMRALLSNCASHVLGPFGKDSDIREWGLGKVGGGTRAEKRKAKTAVARKLAVTMLALWKSERPYDPFHKSKKRPAQCDSAGGQPPAPPPSSAERAKRASATRGQ